MNEILRIDNLSKNFGKNKVLQNFALTLEKGKVYGLLGKNGEGKTTLIRIIMGVIPYDQGEMIYKNKKISFRDETYKRGIGFIAEESIFYNWMSIQELLRFNASFYPRWNSCKADEYLDRFSLDKKAKIRHLSRGMKLKLGLIITLASEPEILLLDDPTSGLDVPTRYDFLKEIIRELSEMGTTILFCTHIVHEIEGIIDNLGILKCGRLIIDEDFQTLKNSCRRVLLTGDESIKDKVKIDGIVTQKANGKQNEWVVYPWTEEKKRAVENLKPASMEVKPMNLEEIFISFVS
ncbi:MAG: ABC transporter ATP-binding protein [Candidatus Aminicenantes bacterium]|nr:ABC transporter ATP-binding protein [Candidatus Aminicenantes bacterium]